MQRGHMIAIGSKHSFPMRPLTNTSMIPYIIPSIPWFKIYLISMSTWPTAFLLVLLCLPLTQAVDCNSSHFDFIGSYTLGKQDELNKTFTKIQEKITVLPQATFVVNETTSYTIFNAKPIFYYRDSKQKAEITGNDTIIITGGRLEADLVFDWKRTSAVLNRTGSGAAFGLSDSIAFVKQAVVIEKGSFYSYELYQAEDVMWSDPAVFNLTRLDPPTATEEDRTQLLKLLNNIMQVKTVRLILEEEIDKIYTYYLRASLHDEHMPIDTQFDYKWVPGNGKPNITVPFTRRATAIDLEEDGARLRYEVQAANASDWRCGNRSVEGILPLNPRVYGYTQEFISYDFYENVIRYAISKNLLDADLNRDSWQSRMFQFYAGDLYEVLDKVQQRFFAETPVTGICRATYTGLKVYKSGFDTFNVSIHFDCELNIQRTKILDFGVGLQGEVEVLPQESTLDFAFRRHTEFTTFYPYSDYKLVNEELARLMVNHSVNRLRYSKLFGSGWPQSPPRDYPHMMAEDNFTVVYDSTHVDPHMTK